MHFIVYVTPCRKFVLHHMQNRTDITASFLLVLKTLSINLQPNSIYHLTLLTNSHLFFFFFPDSEVLTVSKFFATFSNVWQSYWDHWEKFFISSSNIILNSGCLSKFIDTRDRNTNVLSKQDRPNAMKKGCGLHLLSKIGQRDNLQHSTHCVLQIDGLQLREPRCALGGLSTNGAHGELA